MGRSVLQHAGGNFPFAQDGQVGAQDSEVSDGGVGVRAEVDVSKPNEVVGWCNKWGVTPERLKVAVAEVGPSALDVARALGKAN